jgi:hypothetical protein
MGECECNSIAALGANLRMIQRPVALCLPVSFMPALLQSRLLTYGYRLEVLPDVSAALEKPHRYRKPHEVGMVFMTHDSMPSPLVVPVVPE